MPRYYNARNLALAAGGVLANEALRAGTAYGRQLLYRGISSAGNQLVNKAQDMWRRRAAAKRRRITAVANTKRRVARRYNYQGRRNIAQPPRDIKWADCQIALDQATTAGYYGNRPKLVGMKNLAGAGVTHLTNIPSGSDYQSRTGRTTWIKSLNIKLTCWLPRLKAQSNAIITEPANCTYVTTFYLVYDRQSNGTDPDPSMIWDNIIAPGATTAYNSQRLYINPEYQNRFEIIKKKTITVRQHWKRYVDGGGNSFYTTEATSITKHIYKRFGTGLKQTWDGPGGTIADLTNRTFTLWMAVEVQNYGDIGSTGIESLGPQIVATNRTRFID